jgi:hypothetical protein
VEGSCEHGNEPSGSVKCGFSRRTQLHGVRHICRRLQRVSFRWTFAVKILCEYLASASFRCRDNVAKIWCMYAEELLWKLCVCVCA